MPIKIKVNLSDLKKYPKRVKKNFIEDMASGEGGSQLIYIIQSFIYKGISPVKGYGRFKRYSDSYREAIRAGRVALKTSVSPVNLFQYGFLLSSLQIKKTSAGIVLQFNDKKASYHQDGTKKMPKRRLLPGKGERFSDRILQVIKNAAKNAVNK